MPVAPASLTEPIVIAVLLISKVVLFDMITALVVEIG